MNRRMLLKGVVVGSIAPATHTGTTAAGTVSSGSDPPPNEDDDRTAVNVRFVDIPTEVTGGERLDWTVEVENPTNQPIEPTVAFTVNGESLGTVTLPVDPGETAEPTIPTYRTEPVGTADSITVRVEANGASDEQTVRLFPAPELDEALQFPAPELTVQPDTTVHFEVGAVDPDTYQRTSWWVDGEFVGAPLGPWEGTYYTEQGAHFWQETFDEQGTAEVVAFVDVDGDQYRASWTVTIAPDGLADPSIDAARPEPGILEVERDEPTTLEIDVSDPDGALDRVVWWLTQADVILDVTEVAGETDMATLTVDSGLCDTCLIVPWVITGDGTFTTDSLWQVDSIGLGEDGDDPSAPAPDTPAPGGPDGAGPDDTPAPGDTGPTETPVSSPDTGASEPANGTNKPESVSLLDRETDGCSG